MFYLWLKAVHVVAAILFATGSLGSALLIQWLKPQVPSPDTSNIAVRLRRWNARVTTPAMLVVWALGLTLAMQGGWSSSGWLRVKFILVLALSAMHGMQSGALRRLAAGMTMPRVSSTHTATAALVVAILMLAVAKPL